MSDYIIVIRYLAIDQSSFSHRCHGGGDCQSAANWRRNFKAHNFDMKIKNKKFTQIPNFNHSTFV